MVVEEAMDSESAFDGLSECELRSSRLSASEEAFDGSVGVRLCANTSGEKIVSRSIDFSGVLLKGVALSMPAGQ